MSNEVRMTNVQNPGQDGEGVLIPFGLRNSSFLCHGVLRHSSADVTFKVALSNETTFPVQSLHSVDDEERLAHGDDGAHR